MTVAEWDQVCGYFLEAHGVKHFCAREICDVTKSTVPAAPLLLNALQLIEVLEWLRREDGTAAVRVNSWYRDTRHNARVGGVPTSQHLTCGAADVTKDGRSPEWVADKLDMRFSYLGIGRYPTFTHVDIRGLLGQPEARWTSE